MAISPWALYSLLGSSGSPFTGTTTGAGPFGTLAGSTITQPVQPASSPPSTSVTTSAPSTLATAVSPMPVSSGVPAPSASTGTQSTSPVPVPNSGWTPVAGGSYAWTGTGLPQNDPYGNPLPSGWQSQAGGLAPGSAYIYGANGITTGPYGGSSGGIAGGVNANNTGGAGPAPGSAGAAGGFAGGAAPGVGGNVVSS